MHKVRTYLTSSSNVMTQSILSAPLLWPCALLNLLENDQMSTVASQWERLSPIRNLLVNGVHPLLRPCVRLDSGLRDSLTWRDMLAEVYFLVGPTSPDWSMGRDKTNPQSLSRANMNDKDPGFSCIDRQTTDRCIDSYNSIDQPIIVR